MRDIPSLFSQFIRCAKRWERAPNQLDWTGTNVPVQFLPSTGYFLGSMGASRIGDWLDGGKYAILVVRSRALSQPRLSLGNDEDYYAASDDDLHARPAFLDACQPGGDERRPFIRSLPAARWTPGPMCMSCVPGSRVLKFPGV